MITSSVVRHLNARELTPLKLARWWKGFVLDILTDFVWVRCTTERSMKQMDQAFRGYLVLRLQDSGGWTPAWQQKSALPCLNDSCIHRKKKERYRKYNGKRERWRRCFVLFCFSLKTLWSIKHFEFWDVCSGNLPKDPCWSVTFPICYVQLNLRRKMRRYQQTIYTCGRLLSVSSSTKKKKNKKYV